MAMPVYDTTSSAMKLASGTRSMSDGVTAISIYDASSVSQPCQRVLVQSDPDNVPDMFVGTSSNQPIQLTPGQSFWLRAIRVEDIYYKTATNGVATVVNWIAEV